MLKKSLNSDDISSQSISSLCKLSEGQIIIPCFQNAAPLFPILPKFTNLHPSTTFQRFWNARIEELRNEQLEFEDVAELILEFVFQKCLKYHQSLKDRTITLAMVDELLDQYCDTNTNMETEFHSLEKGICKCLEVETNLSWIGPCIQRMKEYRSLRQHADTANAILKLQETLNLTGNFTIIEQLAEQVSLRGIIMHNKYMV